MKITLRALLLFFSASIISSCGDDEAAPVALSPQQQYERAAVLLKPASEREEPDYKGALRLLQQAADADYLPAILDLAGVYLEGSRDGSVAKDRAKALQLYKRAAAKGSADALYYCGFILQGEGKVNEALAYFKKAAVAGLPEAQYRLGRILLQQNSPEALQLIRMAATSQRASVVASASYTMGCIYQDGKLGVQPDMQLALDWFERSANAGDRRAQHMIGLMYLLGEHLPADVKKGEALLRLSAGQDYVPAIDALVRYLFKADAEAYAEEIRAWSERLQQLRKK